MAVPAELIAGPWTIYVADAGEDHPEISDDVTTPWVKLGANLSDDGITFERDETINEQMTLDSPLGGEAVQRKGRARSHGDRAGPLDGNMGEG